MTTDMQVASEGLGLRDLVAQETNVDKVRSLLPEHLKGDAQRLINEALLNIATGSKELKECSPVSIFMCILQAAKAGLPLDGSLAHAVPYGKQATFIADYKGMIAVAKRCGLIQDCWAREVRKNDVFFLSERSGVVEYEFTPSLGADRGEEWMYFAVATHVDGWRRVEFMTLPELKAIQSRAKSKSGPWSTYPEEMRKKTVIKRLLKTFTDDPVLLSLMKNDADDFTEPRGATLNEVIGGE